MKTKKITSILLKPALVAAILLSASLLFAYIQGVAVLFPVTGIGIAQTPGAAQAPVTEKSNALNDTARFLAGLPVESEAVKPYIDKEFYPKYRAEIDKNWNESFNLNRESIQKWRAENLSDDYSLSVFYPFSGPDILNPLAFYPNAKEIVMFGLEPTGGIPDLKKVKPAAVNQQLSLLLKALNFSLDKAYFITLDMGKTVKPSSINGISAIMVFFLARAGYDIIDMKEINIAKNGSAANGKTADKSAINGIEILFSEKDSKEVKRARYFTLNIVDDSKQVAGFDAYMRKYPALTTVVKSASYLMHWNNFTKIRRLVLDKSDSVIQDDTGIPYRIFKKSSEWEVTHFGRYHKPIAVFKTSYQKELDEDNKRYSAAPIPFVYGYGYGYKDITYHLVLAKKLKKK